MEIDKILRDVPDYKVFEYVNELTKNSEELVREFPGKVIPVSLGKSGKGEEISALKIGKGKLHVVLVGGLHVFEPIGSLMQGYLIRALLENPEYFSNSDVSWTFIKCIDPDRMRMNEGWFKEPRTPLNFLKNYFRPALKHQVSQNFPVEYKEWAWKELLPETYGLTRYINANETNLLYELHNAWFDGAWYQITTDSPPLYPRFRELAINEGIPLKAKDDRMISQPTYLYRSIKDTYERLDKADLKNAIDQICGIGPVQYAREKWNSFGLLCEVPYFFDPRVADVKPSGITRKEAMECESKIRRDLVNFLKPEYDLVKPFLHDSPYRDSVEQLIYRELKLSSRQNQSTQSNSNLKKPITIAEELRSCVLTIFEPDMSTLAMFLSMLQHELRLSPQGIPQVKKGIEHVTERLEERNEALMKQVDLHVSPLRSLVRIQLGSCLYTINYLQTFNKQQNAV